MDPSKLRVAFLAGTLGQGGAERQLFYMVRALKAVRVDVRVYCPYLREYYAALLEAENVPVIWLGRSSSRIVRLTRLAAHLMRFRPHLIQAAHFHMNLPTNIVGRLLGAINIASSRGDISREIAACKPWGWWGIRTAATLAANSCASKDKALGLGVPEGRILVLSNVIDLKDFDAISLKDADAFGPSGTIWAVAVGTICENKRFDRFVRALAFACAQAPCLRGLLVGDGPDRDQLRALAVSQGLNDGRLLFLGRRNDVPALLKQASILVLSSSSEGSPNVLLEAMAARLPIITTPAGDAARLVKAAQAGFVVDHDDVHGMAACLCELANTPQLRARFGHSGRSYVERHHDAGNFSRTLLDTYRTVAKCQPTRGSGALLKLLGSN